MKEKEIYCSKQNQNNTTLKRTKQKWVKYHQRKKEVIFLIIQDLPSEEKIIRGKEVNRLTWKINLNLINKLKGKKKVFDLKIETSKTIDKSITLNWLRLKSKIKTRKIYKECQVNIEKLDWIS